MDILKQEVVVNEQERQEVVEKVLGNGQEQELEQRQLVGKEEVE